ncbi:cyd operon YbgE family protein [Rhodocyclus tenuis]|uniref:cyd operon YbgE family protein n=1 Tax=Rhodocyclus tenuis TaxID=1066 RepID=UPI001902D9ED|nr:cyd operon YbgE family protein [Rhodocyclus tenuis]MBK1678979.1 hypothetical protein [Rhodocyclus tenuis]
MPSSDASPAHTAPGAKPAAGGISPVSLGVGIVLLLLMTVRPDLATGSDGHVDYPLTLLIFWAMNAGFVRGVGFIPRHWLPRILLSTIACTVALALVLLRAVTLGRLPSLL